MGPGATAPGDGGVAAQERLLAPLERSHPGLVLSEAAAEAAERAGREVLTIGIGDRTSWEDPLSATHGSFIALRDYTSAAGSYCREILAGVIAPSGTYTAPTLVCRRTDGRWYVLD